MRADRRLAASLGVAAGLLAVCPGASVLGADAWHPEPTADVQMKAVFTIVVCRAVAPRVCEVRETTADAMLCLAGNRNVAEEQVPEGYVLASFRCVPQAPWLAPEHRPHSGSFAPWVGMSGQGPG